MDRDARGGPVFLFIIYAIAVWYAAFRWRRSWPGFAFVLLGLAGLIGVSWFHYQLNEWTHGGIFLPVLQSMLQPYTVMVTAVGVYIACMPQRYARGECPTCGYSLAGLRKTTICPECGGTIDPAQIDKPRYLPRDPNVPEKNFFRWRKPVERRDSGLDERDG